jgi:hypothetical protein
MLINNTGWERKYILYFQPETTDKGGTDGQSQEEKREIFTIGVCAMIFSNLVADGGLCRP